MAKVAGDRPLAEFRVWDFRPGRQFEDEVRHKFNSAVHHASSSINGSFFLVAVFRRFSFRSTEEYVGMGLHSVLGRGGGAPGGFHIHHEQHSHFRFSVASKEVGFLVYSRKRITTKHFNVYFFLWHGGGANWIEDHKAWEREEEEQWTSVSRKKKKTTKKVTFSSPIKQRSPLVKSQPMIRSQ